MTAWKPGDPTAEARRSARCRRAPRPTGCRTSSTGRSTDGAKVVGGGERKGNFFSPTVLADVTPDNARRTARSSSGRSRSSTRSASEDEAVELANDTPFGLGSYVFTTDAEQAERVADKIDAGMVYVNLVGADGAELPFGGVKRSGSGRELGRYGADEFVNKKLIRVG